MTSVLDPAASEAGASFIVTFRPTVDDFIAMMNDYWTLTASRIRRVYFWKALTIAAALVSAGIAWQYRDPVAALCAALLFCWPLFVPAINRIAYTRVFGRQHLGDADVTIKLDDVGIAAASTLSDQRFPWASVEKITATETHAFFWVHAYLAVILPVAAFRDRATFDRAIDFARSKVHSNGN